MGSSDFSPRLAVGRRGLQKIEFHFFEVFGWKLNKIKHQQPTKMAFNCGLCKTECDVYDKCDDCKECICKKCWPDLENLCYSCQCTCEVCGRVRHWDKMSHFIDVCGKTEAFRYCDDCCVEDDKGILCIEHPEHGWLPTEEACDGCGFGSHNCECCDEDEDEDEDEPVPDLTRLNCGPTKK